MSSKEQWKQAIESAVANGRGILCRQLEDGQVTVNAITPEEFFKAVNVDMPPEKVKFLTEMMGLDFSALERRALAVAISGKQARLIIADDIRGDMSMMLTEPEKEESVQVGNRLVAPNHRTKGKKHNLPFYLGKKRF